MPFGQDSQFRIVEYVIGMKNVDFGSSGRSETGKRTALLAGRKLKEIGTGYLRPSRFMCCDKAAQKTAETIHPNASLSLGQG